MRRRASVVDVFTKKRRSWIMSRIRGRNTRPEQFLFRILRRSGYCIKRHVKALPGSPEVVLPNRRIVLFVNGCLWHGHRNCRRARLPTSNAVFWRHKVLANRKRDRRQARQLRVGGWRVGRFWTCRKLTPEVVLAKIKLLSKR